LTRDYMNHFTLGGPVAPATRQIAYRRFIGRELAWTAGQSGPMPTVTPSGGDDVSTIDRIEYYAGRFDHYKRSYASFDRAFDAAMLETSRLTQGRSVEQSPK